MDGDRQLSRAQPGAVRTHHIRDFEVVFDVAFEQFKGLFADSIHNGALGEGKRVFAALAPQFWRPQLHAHKSRAQLEEHLAIDLMAVVDGLTIEGW